jgi:hypothetical protein
VCTHFGLAHKLAAIKEKLQKEKQVRMVLVVFVSDDTFQHIWYIDGADLLVVGSQPIYQKEICRLRRAPGQKRKDRSRAIPVASASGEKAGCRPDG